MLTILHDFTRNRKSLKTADDEIYNFYLKELLNNKTTVTPQVLEYDKKTLKNLILIQLESFPYEYINNRIAPNLFNLSQRYEFIAPITLQPYSSWTTGGVVLTQCGIPQILPDSNWDFRGKKTFLYNKNIACLSDILGSIGYKKIFALTGTESVMGFGEWRKAKNYQKISQTKNDYKLSIVIADHFLPMMDRDIRGNANITQPTKDELKQPVKKTNKKKKRRQQKKSTKPININNELLSSSASLLSDGSNSNNDLKVSRSRYLVYIRPEDTHIPYNRPRWCRLDNRHLEGYEKCFNCVDFAINKIIERFLELKMQEHTVLAVYPDHTPFGTPFTKENNHLFILFPGMDKVNETSRINRNITYYDFAPTILDMIGVKDYLPKYPFGSSIYSKDNDRLKHDKPDENDLDMIDNFLNFFQPTKKKFKCYKGFHKYDDFVYQDKPCSYTSG